MVFKNSLLNMTIRKSYKIAFWQSCYKLSKFPDLLLSVTYVLGSLKTNKNVETKLELWPGQVAWCPSTGPYRIISLGMRVGRGPGVTPTYHVLSCPDLVTAEPHSLNSFDRSVTFVTTNGLKQKCLQQNLISWTI